MGKAAQLSQRDKLVTQIIDDLKSYGVENEVLALDSWDPALVEGFEKRNVSLVPAMELMYQARKIKSRPRCRERPNRKPTGALIGFPEGNPSNEYH